MEHRSVSDLISQFEPLLRRFEDDDGLLITEAIEEAGCKVGDNYMSVVMRATVKGSRGNGTSYAKSIVTKYLPHHREITPIFRTAELFKNESYFYERLLPLLGDFGPIFIHADGDKIVMEDLKHLGYSVLERRELLDLDHSLATVRILGKLHASSLALKLRDPGGFEELVRPLTEAVFPQDKMPSLGVSINDCTKIAVTQLDSIEPKSEELEVGIRFLKSFGENVYSEMQELVVPGRGEFDVLTHGDCWNNNIMFKHDNAGRVVDVKLIDFQITRHVSPAVDFHYFVYSSPKSSVIEENYDDLVRAYHSAFAEALERNSAPLEARRRLSIDWFNGELRKCAKYGIFTACWIIQAILAEEQDTVDMDQVTMDFMKEFMSRKVQVKPKVAERLNCILVHYVRRYI
ncbi:Ecdysteroid Kinase 20 [Neodiprion lecontei]|nr:Ecdysteroid Kinase 20 [Neodiprion lecontei]